MGSKSFIELFLTLNLNFCILSALMGSKSFIELFVNKALCENLRMIFNLFIFTNPHFFDKSYLVHFHH